MAGPHVVRELQNNLTCPICLDIYTNSMSLSCGHSFCGECIREELCRLRCSQDCFRCPVCSARAGPPRELQPNIQLHSIVEKFLDNPEQDSSHHVEEESEMQCEEKGKSSGQQAHEHLTFESHQASGFRVEDKVLSVVLTQALYFRASHIKMWVYSTKSFSKGWHFWEVNISKSSCWKLGVAHDSFHCYLEMSGSRLRVIPDERKMTELYDIKAISVVRVELDCRRNIVSFHDVSDKNCDPDSSMLIVRMNIPASYPVHAAFSTSSGSLSLLW